MPYRDSLRTPNQYPEPARIGGELASVTRLAPRAGPILHIETGLGFEGGPFSSPSPPEATFFWVFFSLLGPI